MSASAISIKDRELAIEAEEACKVVVFYENTAARVGAMSVCDRLVEQFAEDLDFEFRWWKFKRLGDPVMVGHVMEAATSADIVMFCPQDDRLPAEVSEWVESWAESGVTSDGAIALVLPANVDPAGEAARMSGALKWAARRLQMDFLQVSVPRVTTTSEPRMQELPAPLPAQEPPHAYHWGLNE